MPVLWPVPWPSAACQSCRLTAARGAAAPPRRGAQDRDAAGPAKRAQPPVHHAAAAASRLAGVRAAARCFPLLLLSSCDLHHALRPRVVGLPCLGACYNTLSSQHCDFFLIPLSRPAPCLQNPEVPASMEASAADQANHTLAGVVQRSLPASANIKLVEVNGEPANHVRNLRGNNACDGSASQVQLRFDEDFEHKAAAMVHRALLRAPGCVSRQAASRPAIAAGHRNMARLIAQSAVQVGFCKQSAGYRPPSHAHAASAPVLFCTSLLATACSAARSSLAPVPLALPGSSLACRPSLGRSRRARPAHPTSTSWTSQQWPARARRRSRSSRASRFRWAAAAQSEPDRTAAGLWARGADFG